MLYGHGRGKTLRGDWGQKSVEIAQQSNMIRLAKTCMGPKNSTVIE